MAWCELCETGEAEVNFIYVAAALRVHGNICVNCLELAPDNVDIALALLKRQIRQAVTGSNGKVIPPQLRRGA